jgi:hypothetical protein
MFNGATGCASLLFAAGRRQRFAVGEFRGRDRQRRRRVGVVGDEQLQRVLGDPERACVGDLVGAADGGVDAVFGRDRAQLAGQLAGRLSVLHVEVREGVRLALGRALEQLVDPLLRVSHAATLDQPLSSVNKLKW